MRLAISPHTIEVCKVVEGGPLVEGSGCPFLDLVSLFMEQGQNEGGTGYPIGGTSGCVFSEVGVEKRKRNRLWCENGVVWGWSW